MAIRRPRVTRTATRTAVAVLTLALIVTICPVASAQQFYPTRSVGGIQIGPSGLLTLATLDESGQLVRLRVDLLGAPPQQFNEKTELRKVSLRRLGEAIAKCSETGEPLPNEIVCLGGLQQIQYVFVYPEQQDIVLVGPAEGWKVGPQGMVVGVTTGRPVMLLDDLLVALRSARDAARGGISCSIDPTPEGLARLRAHRFPAGSNPAQAAAIAERLLGPQMVTFTGVPETSHFARVLVAADYRMKRLGMGLDKSPVRGLPSYLAMIRSASSAAAPRWWMEPNYEPLLKSPDGLSWEFRGASVKTMTEQEMIAGSGNRTRTGKANPAAQKWASIMTEKFDALAVADPIFGQLRNCMELAIVGALIVKEDLAGKADYRMTVLLDPESAEIAQFVAPKQINSVASVRGRTFSVSGGVQLNSWGIADKTKSSEAPAKVRATSSPGQDNSWWWN